MNAPPAPPLDETARLRVLRETEVLDSLPEPLYDELTALVAELLQVPICLVSLVDEGRQWFKSRHGLAVSETPRELSFCAHAILQPAELMEVHDASTDPRFADNALVTGEPFIRFYAGAPLLTSDGHPLGTLAAIDRVPRRLTEGQRRILGVLAKQVATCLEVRRMAAALARVAEERRQAEAALRSDYENKLAQERQMRAELDAAEHFRRQINEVLPSVLYVYDLAQRRNVFVNNEVTTLLGHRPNSMMGREVDPVAAHMPEDDRAGFVQHMGRVGALRPGEIAEFVYRMRHADGSWRWFHSRDTVLERGADGAPVKIVGTATDITAVKELEQHQRAREVAEQASLAKNSFIARMSHELRTPLNSVLGFAQLLQAEQEPGTRQATYLGHIAQAGQHLLTLINDTLDLARIESGTVALQMQPLHLDDLVDESLRLVDADARAAGVRLLREGDAGVLAWGDPVRATEVVVNLLTNAVKYNRAGGEVRLRVDGGQAGPAIHVSDTGAGLSEAQVESLFRPFQRLGAELTSIPGTGLGLAICKTLADLMQARLEVHSQPGQGSTFSLVLQRPPAPT